MRRKLDSKGFSLVELLVGVLILAAIVIPLVTAFLTSQKAANKAREIRSQTLAATNVIEAYKATDIAKLLDAFKKAPNTAVLGGNGRVSSITAYNSETGAYDEVTASSKEEPGGAAYKIYMKGVSAGTKLYDAVLSLDASAQYAQLNSAEIVDYKPMDAVYIQADPVKEADNNEDIIAAKTFASQAQIDSGKAVDYQEFLTKMKRKITVTVRKLASGSDTGIISCRVQFHYETTYTYEQIDLSASPPVITYVTREYSTDISNDFYSGSYSPSEPGINGMYFFYHPNSVGQSDTVEILNRDNVALSVYLIRQGAIQAGYTPIINLRETYVGPLEPMHALLHYNSGAVTQLNFKYYAGYPSGSGFNDFWYKSYSFDGILVDTEQKNRMYGMKVELFRHAKSGAGFDPTDFLTSFDAASLE